MKRFLMTMLALLAATFAFGNIALAQGHDHNNHGGGNLGWRDSIEVGGHGWNGHDMWNDPATGDTLTVTGVVLIDTTYFYTHYFLDTDNDGTPEYQLGFGPPWYEPASGAKRPNAGDTVTVFGRAHDDGMMDYDMLVVYTINGLEWRSLTGPSPWSGMWMQRTHGDSLRVYCVNDSTSWMHFPPGHMGMGGMGMWPDSVFIQFWRIHPDSLPGPHHNNHFAGFYINVHDQQGNSMMGRQMGWGRDHMRFDSAQRFRSQYRDEDLWALGLSETDLTIRHWNSEIQQWQDVSGVTINTSTNTVTFASADLSSYYALNAPTLTTGIDDNVSDALPAKFALEQNYPNPFNPSTTIRFGIPEPSLVRLEIFNLLGQKVATLVNAVRPAGEHTLQWNAADDNGRLVTTGVYLMRLEAGNQVMLRRITLLK